MSDAYRVADEYPRKLIRSFKKTKHGEILWGDSRSYLFNMAAPSSIDLIMTSPPFGLVRKKDYGNEDADRYCDWFRPFAEGFLRVLKDAGSLVIDIGGAWIPGTPTRSLYHFKLLIMLVEEYGFHLCQEHYWWNPAKLPTPAEWVNVRRVRVKDAVNCVWWLSKTPFPKANNKRVLQPYSKSMEHLLRNGYVAKKRPSGHDISEKFQKDNGGAVPPNLLAVANTESTSRYQEHCRQNNLPIHPARFPAHLPEYFIRMLTDVDDLVVDPFAGSCVTGAVAEALKRKWVCCEMSEEYLQGALARFDSTVPLFPRAKPITYEIVSPCAQPVPEDEAPLSADGGATRLSRCLAGGCRSCVITNV
jgi:DNA modification methylase